MSDANTDRIIGRLEEFKSTVETRLQNIETELKDLNQFKWKVIGGASALSFLLAGAIEIAKNIPHLPWKE
jgi:guanylate kinase